MNIQNIGELTTFNVVKNINIFVLLLNLNLNAIDGKMLYWNCATDTEGYYLAVFLENFTK